MKFFIRMIPASFKQHIEGDYTIILRNESMVHEIDDPINPIMVSSKLFLELRGIDGKLLPGDFKILQESNIVIEGKLVDGKSEHLDLDERPLVRGIAYEIVVNPRSDHEMGGSST